MVNFKTDIVPYMVDLKQSSLNFIAVFTNNNFFRFRSRVFHKCKGNSFFIQSNRKFISFIIRIRKWRSIGD
jgi:hypothetical protein